MNVQIRNILEKVIEAKLNVLKAKKDSMVHKNDNRQVTYFKFGFLIQYIFGFMLFF